MSMIVPIMSNFRLKEGQGLVQTDQLIQKRRGEDKKEVEEEVIYPKVETVVHSSKTCPIHSTETLISTLPDHDINFIKDYDDDDKYQILESGFYRRARFCPLHSVAYQVNCERVFPSQENMFFFLQEDSEEADDLKAWENHQNQSLFDVLRELLLDIINLFIDKINASSFGNVLKRSRLYSHTSESVLAFDKFSRTLFPATFLLTNGLYWFIYCHVL